MARPARPASDHLTYLARAAARSQALEPLALLRGAEARARALPRIGEARLPAQDIASLAQTPALAFPAATLSAIAERRGRPRLEGHWLGLTGPMAPLPLHLSEFAAYERRYSRTRPFGDWLDVLAGRMLQLFYRSWANASPAASADRPEADRFAAYVAALTGAGEGTARVFPARARLRYAGLFVGPRSPAALADALTDLMRLPVRVTEFVPRWRDIAGAERSRLGRAYVRLGEDAVSGVRQRSVADAFRVTLAIPDAATLDEALPGGRRFALIAEALDAFAPPHLDWDVALAVAPAAIRSARLGGGARLGWSGWLGATPASAKPRTDTRLGASARRLAARTRMPTP
ncbi:type VI secretion system baseplate subunit TssG [Sphingomonas morindae]|uniref:Type VI secretion system baseplate subunit TssG n=1 Tax=Sphingomonas morindae TaxID=1541170 RepID=A0ABY4XD56_9SPHN|nr:type VI secretion system baseplate subunit TssG [Sphingomonas morindae]USI74905.1 type VI secretion system baseplate subunit TssG [Sphingomonas morindae]